MSGSSQSCDKSKKDRRERGAISQKVERNVPDADSDWSDQRATGSSLYLSFFLSPSNLPQPILGPMRRLLRLLASIWTPCRSGGWLRARAPRVAMTTTIAPPLTEVLNRTLLATWPHMFSALLQPLFLQATLAPTESGEGVLSLWKTHRNPRLSIYCWSWVTQILWQLILEHSGFTIELKLKSQFVKINPFNYYNTVVLFFMIIK